MFSLENKTALITGASSGLGAEAAKIFATAGAKVIITGRREERLQTIAKEIGAAAKYIVLDVTDEKSRDSLMEKLESNGDKIDVFFNNAGVAEFTPIFADFPKGDFEKNFETNVFGFWHMLKLIANHMKEYKIKGSIINTASIAGVDHCSSRGASYGASKASVIHITTSVCEDLGRASIRVNSISPGFFRTEMTETAVANRRDELIEKTPLGFIANPDQLAGTLLYLASNEASPYTTGTNIIVDGGLTKISGR